MKITVELLGASEEQRNRFALPLLPATLEGIRSLIGDAHAEVVVHWGPGEAKAVHHVVQSLADFPPAVLAEFASSEMAKAVLASPTHQLKPSAKASESVR